MLEIFRRKTANAATVDAVITILEDAVPNLDSYLLCCCGRCSE